MPDLDIRALYPESGRIILTGGGKEFIEKIGIEAAKKVVLGVLKGENIRNQTEPLTRRRVAQVTAAIVALFARGVNDIDNFTDRLSSMALEQILSSRKNDNMSIWPAQWLIGLTGKAYQNVLRSRPESRAAYISDFESAVKEAADKCEKDFGPIRMALGFVEQSDRRKELDWEDITRLTTAIGSATLTIRGSDKSIYGKLFERLVLGSVLSILGFERVDGPRSSRTENAFWLSDSSDLRECDGTVRLRPGKLARFDIGFIGKGNPEIMKNKLTRYASEVEVNGLAHGSQTFIIVDTMPDTQKTRDAAEKTGAEVVQMSMQHWPRDLARRMQGRLKFQHELTDMRDDEIDSYLERKIAHLSIQDFLSGVSVADIENETALAVDETEMDGDE